MTPLELTEARKALGLSQAALARTLGVSTNTTNRWEKGERPIPPYLRLALVGLSVQLQAGPSGRIVNAYDDSDRASRAT